MGNAKNPRTTYTSKQRLLPARIGLKGKFLLCNGSNLCISDSLIESIKLVRNTNISMLIPYFCFRIGRFILNQFNVIYFNPPSPADVALSDRSQRLVYSVVNRLISSM